MKFDDVLTITFKNLAYRRLKSWLTIIGIVIGIASVVGLISFGGGIQEVILSQLGALGSENIIISPGGSSRVIGRSMDPHGIGEAQFTMTAGKSTLTLKDVQAISKLPKVEAVGYTVQEEFEITYRGEVAGVTTTFVDPDAFKALEDPKVIDGRLLSKSDQFVALLGYKAAHEFFTNELHVGDVFNIEGSNVRVIGILEEEGGGFVTIDNYIFINLNVVKKFVPEFDDTFDVIEVKAKTVDDVPALVESITKTLRRLHKTKEDDFQVFTYASIMETVLSITGLFTSFLAGIAAISLLVGAVGIANSMFTSVYERTREIGIMKAVGAKSNDILLLFITEAGIMSLIGGLVGISLGLLIANGLAFVINAGVITDMPSGVQIAISITTELIVLALSFSVGIGVISGLLPARKAAKLDPIEAIWYE